MSFNLQAQVASSELERAELAAQKAMSFREESRFDSAVHWFMLSGDLYLAQENWYEAVTSYFVACNMYQFLGQSDQMVALIKRCQQLITEHMSPTHELLAESHFGLMTHYYHSGDFQHMRKHARIAREIYSKQTSSHNPRQKYLLMAIMSTNLEEHERAIAYCDTIIQFTDTMVGFEGERLRLGALQKLQSIYSDKGNMRELIQNLEQQKAIALKHNREDILDGMDHNIGGVYLSLKDYERAISHFRGGKKEKIMYIAISDTYLMQEQLDSAEFYLQKALNSTQIVPYGNDIPELDGYLFLRAAEFYASVNQAQLADSYYKKSLDWYKSSGLLSRRAGCMVSYSGYLLRQNRNSEATQILEEVIDLFEDTEQKQHYSWAQAYQFLGEIAEEKAHYESALSLYSKAIQKLSFSRDTSRFPNPESTLDPANYLPFLNSIAHCLLKRGDSSSQDLKKALETVHIGFETIGYGLKRSKGSDAQEAWAEESSRLCELGIRICYNLFEQTQDQQYIHQAFQFSETGKSILLQASMNQSYAIQFAGLPDSLLQREQQINLDFEFYWKTLLQKQHEGEQDSILLAYYQDQVDRLQEESYQFQEYLESHFPAYFELKYQQTPIGLSQVQQSLKQTKQTLIEYFWGEEAIYAFGVNASDIYFEKLSTDSIHYQVLDSALHFLHNPSEDIEFQYLYELFSWLVAPVLEKAKSTNRLVIIPDGALGYLPFDLLVSEPSTSSPYFLINQYSISYANSASLLLSPRAKPASEIPFLGFGPTYKGQLQLPYSKKEIEQLAQIMGGDFFVGDLATEAAFRENGPRAEILHFAMHGFLSSDDPMQSYLLFQSDSSDQEDNKLSAFELYNMDLTASLAVLSACHTGYGPIAKGEGIRSLARAFQYAGCPSIVMSLWEANGIVAKDLMPLFYQNLNKGLPKDIALQQAKLSFLGNAPDHLRDPRMWGNFVMIGDANDLTHLNQTLFWPLLIGGLLLLTLGSGVMIFRSSRS